MPEIILFAIGLIALQVVPIIVQENQEKEQLHFDEAFLIPMFMMMSPITVMLTMALATTVTHIFLKKEWYKTLFNVTQISVSALIGALIAGSGLIGAVGGAIVYAFLTGLSVFALFKYLHADWESNFSFRVIVLGSSLVLGITMATRLEFTSIAAIATVASQLGYQNFITRPNISLVTVDI